MRLYPSEGKTQRKDIKPAEEWVSTLKNSKQGIITIPQKAREGSVLRDESAMSLLDRIKKFNAEWVRNGYRNGSDANNVSATVSIKDADWQKIGQWMWENKASYNGLSVLPYDHGNCRQAPFEDISRELFESLEGSLKDLHLSKVFETGDVTELQAEAACAGGACSVV